MQQIYTKAFLSSLQSGLSVEDALTGLKSSLKKHRYEKLLASILRAVLRELQTRQSVDVVSLKVAKSPISPSEQAALEEAIKTLGATKEVIIEQTKDQTLIGGFVATYRYKEYDRSYKELLRKLYESIITA